MTRNPRDHEPTPWGELIMMLCIVILLAALPVSLAFSILHSAPDCGETE
jgi:hypothetical protein